ncbi:hypothetical protein VNO78_03272 [Psophocarpus tetragonolobus]|uniref:PPC domain-containing protein n=1 Tax=Psophocarpus tetragonolobus TaxID=3891 RepID=A0AAN9TDP5_PSOTE
MAHLSDGNRGSSEQQPLSPSPQQPKRPRGRPLGSKNKGKFATLPGNEPDDPTADIMLINVSPDKDVIETVTEYGRLRHVSLAVLSASGTVNSVTLRNSPHGNPTLTLYGPFSLLSITGAYLYNQHYILHPGANPPKLSFGINLSNSHGELFCGTVAGRVVAGQNVCVTVSAFTNPHVFRHVPETNAASATANAIVNDNDNNSFPDFTGIWD